MENIIKNPGLQHLFWTTLCFLDKNSITSFRLVNQDCKNIADDPLNCLRKLSQSKNTPKDLIEYWKKIIHKLHAANEVKPEIATELFKMYCISDAKYPLELAYKLAEDKDKPEVVTTILENSDPNSYMVAPMPLIGNLRPIHIAAAFGNIQAAKKLISNSWACSAVEFQDEHGITPMALAAQDGHLEVVKLLLSFPGNPNIPCIDGRTPIYTAAENGHIEIVKLLMSLMETPNTPTNKGRTPMHCAAYNGHIEIIRLLMSTTATALC